jgi:hypothetical protein
MDAEKFDSDLGEVAITKTRIERRRSESEEWERIKEHFSDEKLVDIADYKHIDDINLEKGSIYPNIKLEIDGEMKRMFFHVGDPVEEIFRRLRYRWHSYHQNHSKK